MLLNKGIVDLCDDNFEGSNDERQIFTEVFFGSDIVQFSKRCLVTGVINFECESSETTMTSFCSNIDYSVITSPSASKSTHPEVDYNLIQDSRKTAQGCTPERFYYDDQNDEDVNVKRMKFSLHELPCSGFDSEKVLSSSALSKEPFSDLSCSFTDSGTRSKTITLRLVESSKHGVTSTCYLLNRSIILNEQAVMNGVGNRKCKLATADRNVANEVAGNKMAVSPVSQESFANRFAVTSPSITVLEQSGSPLHPEEMVKGLLSSDIDMPITSLNPDFKKDLRTSLQFYIVQLLKMAGWSIEKRKRPSRHYMESVYRTPQGRLIREFTKAWRLCGQLLSVDKCNFMREECTEWADINHFWSDLSIALVTVEKGLNQSKTAAMLAYQWWLLDPFVIVIYVSRKIGALKKGELVKATQSLVFGKYETAQDPIDSAGVNSCKPHFNQIYSPAFLCDSFPFRSQPMVSVLSYHACHKFSGDGKFSGYCEQKNNGAGNLLPGVSFSISGQEVPDNNPFNIGSQCRRTYVNQVSRLDQFSLSGYELDSPGIQSSTCNFNIPITSGNSNQLLGGPDVNTCNQDTNRSSQSSDKLTLENDQETNMIVDGDVPMNKSKEKSVLIEGQVRNVVDSYLPESVDNHPMVHSQDYEAVRQNEFSGKDDGKSSRASMLQRDNFCSATNVNLKRKIRKKCKKISKVKLSMLYQTDMLDSTVVDQVQSLNGDAFGTQLLLDEVQENLVDSAGKKEIQGKLSSIGAFQQQIRKTNTKFRKTLHKSGFRTGKKESSRCQPEDDELLVSAIIKNKDFVPKTPCGIYRAKSCKSRTRRKLKSQKGRCKLLPRNSGNGAKHAKDGKKYSIGERTVLSWLIENGAVSVNDVIQYRNPKDNSVIRDGRITRDGVVCKCCGKVLTLSEFKFHAGFGLNRPCLNLFMESGEPFTLCLLQAWSAEYKARKSGNQAVRVDDDDRNDDSCGLCGDVGELICCDNCPSTFHLACLCVQELPEGNWYCTNCTCRTCGNLVNDKEASGSYDGLQCLQCEHKYHKKCLKGRGKTEGEDSDTWFCGQSCQEVYSGLQSLVGLSNCVADGFSWMLLRCIHDDQKVHSAQWFALKAVCNTKLAVALTIMEECFLSMVDPRTGINMLPHVLYNWGSDFARLNFQGFYTVVLERQDVLISVASIRVHGTTVAEMPLIATCSRYRQKGMCRFLVSAIEEMLISVKVQKLVIAAIPDLVETWTKGFGFRPVDDVEKQRLNKINLMVFPGTLLLEKTLYEKDKVEELRDSSTLTVDELAKGYIWSEGQNMAEPLQQDVGNTNIDKVGAKLETEHVRGKNGSDYENDGKTNITKAINVSLEANESTKMSTCFRGEKIIKFTKQSDSSGKSIQGTNMLELEVGSEMHITTKPVQQLSENCCMKKDCADSEVRTIAEENIKVAEVLENTSQDHFSELSCNTYLDRNFGMDSNIESSEMYVETHLSLEQHPAI